MSHPDVVVVGAGVIGMACARELAGALGSNWVKQSIRLLFASLASRSRLTSMKPSTPSGKR